MQPTGFRPLDMLIGGGFPEGIVSQIYGEPGSGKSHICLQTLATALKMGKKVVFIDSDTNFYPERVLQLIGDEALLEKVFVLNPKNFSDQAHCVRKGLRIKPALLIIDSMTALYRIEENQEELLRQMHLLNQYTKALEIPIIITNQVYLSLSTRKIEPLGGNVMKYFSKLIIEVKKKGQTRIAHLIRHPFLKEGKSIAFMITKQGLREA